MDIDDTHEHRSAEVGLDTSQRPINLGLLLILLSEEVPLMFSFYGSQQSSVLMLSMKRSHNRTTASPHKCGNKIDETAELMPEVSTLL